MRREPFEPRTRAVPRPESSGRRASGALLAAACALLLTRCGETEPIPGLPVADAGFDRVVSVGSELVLDGSGSYDPNQLPVTYEWRLLSRPRASEALLVGAHTAQPRITPDAAGIYLLSLVVSNGKRESRPDTVSVSARDESNQPPVAAVRCEAGMCEAAHAVGTLRLSAATSFDADGDALSYTWSQVSSAAQCAAACPDLAACDPLADPATLTAGTSPDLVTLTAPDAVGTLVIRVEVSDGELADSVCIPVLSTNNAPISLVYYAPGTAPEGQWFRLDGTASGDTDAVDVGRLTYAWSHEPASVPVEYDPPTADVASVRARVHGLTANTAVTFTLTVSDPFTSSDPCGSQACGRACCGQMQVQVADAALADGQACGFDSTCASGNCECADPACAGRLCAVSSCVCQYDVDGGGCDGDINDGIADPEDCDLGSICEGGTCI